MVDSGYARRRDTLCKKVRELIKNDQKNFEIAGKTLEKLYPASYMEEWKTYPGGLTPAMILRDQLDAARRAAINGDQRPGYNQMDFRVTALPADRQDAARLVVLSILLAVDPLATSVVSVEVCAFAAVPWPGVESDVKATDDVETWLDGRDNYSWNEPGWSNGREPSPRVLDLLEEAMAVVLTGTNAAGGALIPSGDGRPCDQPGLNPYDELHRALRDLVRHVSVFDGNAAQWIETHQYDSGDKLQEKREWLLDYTRQWWETWGRAVERGRDGIAGVKRDELMGLNSATLKGLAKLNSLFGEPLMYLPHEMPGDHLLLRPLSVLGFRREDGRFLVSNYPRERAGDAVRPMLEHIEALGLFLNETVDDQSGGEQVVEMKPVSTLRGNGGGRSGKPTKYEDATRSALAIVRKEGWPRWCGKPSVNRLAERVGCSPHTLRKAIENSKELRHLKDREEITQPTEGAELATLMLDQERDARSDRLRS